MRNFTQTWQTNWNKKLNKYVPLLAVVAIFGSLGTWFLVNSHAATPVASIQAETGTVSATATKVSDATASGSQAVKFGSGSSGGGTCSGGTKPDASNTGVPAGMTLTTVNGDMTVTTAGTIVDSKDIKGLLIIKANNVTVKNTLVEGRSTTSFGAAINIQSGTGILIDHVTVNIANPTVYLDGIWASNATIQCSDISKGVDGMKASDNSTIQYNYIHDLSEFSSDPSHNGGPTHNDTIQILDGANLLVQGNNLVAISDDNSAIQVTQDYGPVTNLRVNSNWADGGGCTFNFAHTNNPLTVTANNNRFGRNSFYDCPILISTQTTLMGTGNVWDDNNQAVPVQQHD